MPNWFSALLVFAVGFGFLAYGVTVIWGFLLIDSAFVRRARSQYAELPSSSRGLSRARWFALAPLVGLAFVATGIDLLVPPDLQLIHDLLRVVLVAIVLSGVLALISPRPFIPAWMRETETRLGDGRIA